MIDIEKQYKTRNGMEVRIYSVDGGGPEPIHGAYYMLYDDIERLRNSYQTKGYWVSTTWPTTGKFRSLLTTHHLDLVEVDIDVEEGHGLK